MKKVLKKKNDYVKDLKDKGYTDLEIAILGLLGMVLVVFYEKNRDLVSKKNIN